MQNGDAILQNGTPRRVGQAGGRINNSAMVIFQTHEMMLETPETTFGVPETTLGVPETTLGAPETTLGTPETTYDAPETTLGTPETTYGTPEMIYRYPDLNNNQLLKDDLYGEHFEYFFSEWPSSCTLYPKVPCTDLNEFFKLVRLDNIVPLDITRQGQVVTITLQLTLVVPYHLAHIIAPCLGDFNITIDHTGDDDINAGVAEIIMSRLQRLVGDDTEVVISSIDSVVIQQNVPTTKVSTKTKISYI